MIKRSSLIILMLMILAVSQISANAPDAPVEVIEIKEVGLSDKDETKSVIEVRWQINPAMATNVRSFKIFLSVIYADGTKVNIVRHADEESAALKIEVPSASFSNRNAPAFIKNLKAMVIAKSIKTAKVQEK